TTRVVIVVGRRNLSRQNFIGNSKNRPRCVRREQRAVKRLIRHDFVEFRQLFFSLVYLSFPEKRGTTSVMPLTPEVRADRWRLGLVQHLVPLSKTCQRVIRHNAKPCEQ